MGNNSHYWVNKEERANVAKEHTLDMESVYSSEIKDCIKNTIIYSPTSTFVNNQEEKNMEIIIEPLDSVSAIMKYSENGIKISILNFSSYKNPGGMFINGSKAQEECLCHESFLYNVLKEFQTEFYDWNCTKKNKALYLNRCLYSPNVKFVKDKIVDCDVITCAAPNKSAAQMYQSVSNEENYDVLKSRIKFILDIAKENKVDTLILGAYGCGVFGQNPTEVATIFKEFLETEYKCFSKVVFAILKDKTNNLESFEKVFH